jgi:hypothetical protein
MDSSIPSTTLAIHRRPTLPPDGTISSAIATISFAEIGIGVATFGQGIWGMAAKELGKVVTDNASDAGYTGSIMEMEGFTIGLDGILKANNYYYDGTAP